MSDINTLDRDVVDLKIQVNSSIMDLSHKIETVNTSLSDVKGSLQRLENVKNKFLMMIFMSVGGYVVKFALDGGLNVVGA